MMMQYYYITIFTIQKYTKMYHFLYYYYNKMFASFPAIPSYSRYVSRKKCYFILAHCVCQYFALLAFAAASEMITMCTKRAFA